MYKFPSSKLIAKFSSLFLAIVIMLGVFLGNPINAQANVITSNFNGSVSEMISSVDGVPFPLLLADAAVEPEAVVETPEEKAAAKLEAKKVKAAAKLEAKKLKEAAEAEAEKVKAAEKAAKKAAKLEAKKAKEAAKLEAKKAKEAEKAAVVEEEKVTESPDAPSAPAAEATVETELAP